MSELKKQITFPGLIALGMGGIVGTSWIYTNSRFFAKYGAGGEIFGFLLATLLATFIALAYAELSTAFPRAGGEVVYTYVALGKGWSFAAGWALIGAYLSSLAFYVAAAGWLFSWAIPQIESGPYYMIAGMKIYVSELIIGVALALLITWLNYVGIKSVSIAQIVMVSIKILLGLTLVAVGFGVGKVGNFWPAWSPDMNPTLATLRFVLPAMTYLTGFELVAVMAEEANMPPRRIGLGVISSVILAGLFYTIVLLSSAWVIPWQDTAKMELGTIDAFKAAGFPALSIAAYLISLLGLGTAFLGLFAATPRLILSLARAKILPESFTKTHPKYGTPINAIYLTLAFAVGLGWLGKRAIIWFLDIGGFTVAAAWILAVISLFVIRKKYPNLERPYKVSSMFYPIIGAIMAGLIAISTLIPGTDLSLEWPYEYIILAVWIVVGFILYLYSPRGEEKEALKELLGPEYSKIAGEKGDKDE
ncbi:APC family permease [Caldanaerobacter sp.]|uniref:APC family permease n=1 Tax=Caldanaerobacter sp. TaxID=2930036 RepID=UPI003C728BA7